jgi:hypothetical protein
LSESSSSGGQKSYSSYDVLLHNFVEYLTNLNSLSLIKG